MARPVRRIVTGHRADGRSTVLMDGAAPNVKQRKAGNASTLLWVTDESPANVSGGADAAAREIGVPPPGRGSIFRIAPGEQLEAAGGLADVHVPAIRGFKLFTGRDADAARMDAHCRRLVA